MYKVHKVISYSGHELREKQKNCIQECQKWVYQIPLADKCDFKWLNILKIKSRANKTRDYFVKKNTRKI